MQELSVMGLPVRVGPITVIVDELISARTQHLSADRPLKPPYRLVNAYSITLAHRDDDYGALLRGRGTNIPDGRAVSLLSSVGVGNGSLHVRGPAVFEECLARGRAHGVRHFLLGSDHRTLDLLRSRIEARFPGVNIVGAWSPPFRPLTPAERDEQDEVIRTADPDLVWVGLGTPKQDFEAARLASLGFVTVGVGAAFDFVAGTKPEAPRFLRVLGLEWAFRLACEPRRLWRRYLIGNVRFVALLLRHAALATRAALLTRRSGADSDND